MSCRHSAFLSEQGELRGLFITPLGHCSATDPRGGVSAQYYKSKSFNPSAAFVFLWSFQKEIEFCNINTESRVVGCKFKRQRKKPK